MMIEDAKTSDNRPAGGKPPVTPAKILFAFGSMAGLVLCIVTLATTLITLAVFRQNETMAAAAQPEIGQFAAPTPLPGEILLEERQFIYRVQPGDNLNNISKLLAIPVDRLIEANQPISETHLLPGQTFLVPQMPAKVAAQPTPVTTRQPNNALKPSTDAQTVQQRMINSSENWQTLWVDLQIADYGPTSYIGSPRLYHLQAWIRQPGESLELFGAFPGPVTQVHVLANGIRAERSPLDKRAVLSTANQTPEELIKDPRLKTMVFPGAAAWLNEPVQLQVGETEEIAGRQALAASWLNPSGQVQVRLWIDAITGLVLRMQEYGGAGYQTLLSDTLVTAIEYDRDLPSIFVPGAVWQTNFSGDYNAQAVADSSSIALALPYAGREVGAIKPAPANFEAAGSRLSFLYPAQAQLLRASGNAEIPINLLADGFLLGETKFGLPWGLQCERSPDGARIAFTSATDGAAEPDLSLRWFNINNPGVIFQPLPEIAAEYFIFSPDGQLLAVFGRQDDQKSGSIYIVDLATGESKRLLELWHAGSLVWSPDGDQLAFIGQEPGQPAALYFLHIQLAEVVHTQAIDYNFFGDSGWSGALWEANLPRKLGDMDQCAQSPGK